MSAPTWHEFKFLRNTFPEIPISDGWKFPTLKSDDVIWNIVLAYLNSFPVSNKNELTQRMKYLTGFQKVNEHIEHSIEICNPFLHRSACFCDKELSELVTAFKERVEDYIKSDERLFHTPAKNFKYLEASSKLLSCNIVLISFPFQNKILVNVFPVQTFPHRRSIYPKHILILDELIFTSKNETPLEKFSFCIPEEIGTQKQRQALAEILKRTRMFVNKEKIIQRVTLLPDVTENFLISILKNDFGHFIPFIFESPYVLSKLADACFETDPRTKDSSGKSAFFHALKTEESQLVSLLYDHAANACLQTDASVRSPDPVIVENLLCLKDYLKLLEKDLESEEISEKSRCLYRDVCRFNEFQIEMCKNVNKIRLRINYYDQTEEYEVMQRKEIIEAILKTYKRYFDYDIEDSAVSINVDDNLPRFREFYKHRDYFDKLDFSSAVMFFDNLFLLKERLKLQNTVYLDVESIFFLFIFCRKYLEQYENQKRFYFVSRWITLQERLSLQRQMCGFKEILENTELSKDNIVDKLPEAAVRTLTNLPQIYGQFLIFRLQHYLNAATELTVKDLKSILVIERCLQVMGECFKESDFNSVQRILILGLPSDFIRTLKQIRNHLAHIKLHELPYRNILEQDTELFMGIQDDLSELKKLLQPIYSIHKYQLDLFLLLHSIKSICKARRRRISEVHENQLKAILPSLEMEENHLVLPTSSRQTEWKQYFDDMRTSLKEKINDLNYKGNILNRNTTSLYKFIIQNMISAVRDVLRNSKASDAEKDIEEMDSHLWCLENVLTYMTKDGKLAEYRRSLLLMLKDRKSLFTELKEKTRNIKDGSNSNIDGSPIRDDTIIGKHLSSGPGDNRQGTVNPIDAYTFQHGVLFNMEPGTSIYLNENEENRSMPESVESSERSQLQSEISESKFKNGVLENECHGSILQETIGPKESKEYADFSEDTKSPEEEYPIEGNDSKFSETISMTSHNDWLLDNVFNIYHDYPVNSEEEGPVKLMEFVRNRSESSKFNNFIDKITKILDDYEKIADAIFQKIPARKNIDFRFKNIEKYCLILKGWKFLNKKEKEIVIQSVPKQFQNVPELKRNVKALLKQGTNFTEEIKTELFKLNMRNKEMKEIAENLKFGLIDDADSIVDSTRDYFLDLKEMMESKKIDRREYELLSEKLELSDDAKNILLKLVPGQNKKVPGNQFEFLRKRIKMLKNILIEENNAIQQLWERATTPRRKMHVKEKIIQLYLKDSEIQASVETLLFDCMNTLSSKDLIKLWKKTTNLFNGINLRNVLAHGHPLLESLGRLLDPYDLPSELVDRMLKLIADEYAMDCMQQILEQSGTDFSGFMTIMNDEEGGQFKNLRKQILECDHWKEYAWLIPLHKVRKV
ncbi:hypothetical protein AVEN_74231-1 [Araneus ventricosus]|uniref:Uncharacterized protein n=1 Tax=Araneus ventricosus TaxID=182803 RepID=A0A4Y2ETS0_ARAVE|nr:hypothetical protein AVEN_74231-1 [Araneus ventricosus]